MKLQCQRPKNFREFVGKQSLKNNLQIYIKAAVINNRTLDHCLFYGLPGTGKTSLAYIVANQLKSNIKIIQGNCIQKNIDVYNFAMSIKQGDIIFIDEIHMINKNCFELLYPLMEDFCLDVTIGKDFNAKVTRLKVPSFTLIAATTSLSKIPKPLEDRFGIIFYFDDYTNNQIKTIILNALKKAHTTSLLNNDDAELIASYSKNNPRNALTILSRVIDFKLINKNIKIKKILKEIGLYYDGLNINDIKYLKCFNETNKCIGIKTISQMTNFEIQFIEEKIEPFLVKKNYINKTSKGRIITYDCIAMLKKIEK